MNGPNTDDMSQDELDLWSDINNPNNDASMDDWADAHYPNNDDYLGDENDDRVFTLNPVLQPTANPLRGLPAAELGR